MKIDINENAKIVALWFTNQENPQENLPLDIEKETSNKKKRSAYMPRLALIFATKFCVSAKGGIPPYRSTAPEPAL